MNLNVLEARFQKLGIEMEVKVKKGVKLFIYGC